ncbi:unnamed protein product [Gongylonema pulchrum]|uniref:Uncharacterized protein n=1 Tax=Gongylonema pulchrum TaxID=637853 RepID=A0A183DD79_9BILA|nr:unnamed protein product [Gongylonema pulchrum]
MSWIALFGSVGMVFTYFFSYSLTSPASPIIDVEPSMADTILHILSSPVALAYILFALTVSLFLDILYKVYDLLCNLKLHWPFM